MKKIIFILCIVSCILSRAQTVEQFYDWQWKPCEPGLSRFYSITKNTDSGWYRSDYYTANNKLQMKGLYKDSACKIKNGRFVYFYPNGNISAISNYTNNKLQGTDMSFYYDGMMKDSGAYNMGKPVGTMFAWHRNGYASDSLVYNPDGSAVKLYWFDNGVPFAAGKTQDGKLEGAWIYYHKNGQTAALEKYQQGKLLSRIYYTEEGKEITDTTNRDRHAQFDGGLEKWKRYLERNLVFPVDNKLVNTNIVTVVIAAVIGEDGKVEDAYVEIPFKPAFDNEALRIIKRSPKWLPAIDHNRKVKGYIRQPVSFMQ